MARTKIEIFFAYAHEDEPWRIHLDKHLSALRRQKRIATWHDYKITPGTERLAEINIHLSTAQIIVLLISPDFLASDRCWSLLKKAIKRHNAGAVRVIPVIVRPVDWEQTPFAKLQTLPRNGNAISLRSDRDEALAEIAIEIRNVIQNIQKNPSPPSVSDTKHIPRKGSCPFGAMMSLRNSSVSKMRSESRLEKLLNYPLPQNWT